jgi:hypothetical protein
MKVDGKTLIPFACCVALMAMAWTQTGAPSQWKTYRSSAYGFTIEYPRTMTVYPPGPVRPPEHSTIPVCDETAVACFEYNGHALDHTIIQAVGVSIDVLREKGTKEDCEAFGTAPAKTIWIHGRAFRYVERGGAAAGSSEDVRAYRTFSNHVCFEAAVHRAQLDVAPAQYAEYGIRPLNRSALRQIESEMDRMARSFALVGPVQEEAGWSVFSGSRCGESFAYPGSASVASEDPSRLPVFNAWQVSCVDQFSYDQRQYTVAAKTDLPNAGAVNTWLDSTGFPRLDAMHAIIRGPALTEYRGPDILYFVHGSSLYLITATDGSGEPVPMERDGVAERLARSFRVQ